MGILDNAKDALGGDQVEQHSDNLIQQGTDKINDATGNKYADQVNQGAEFADGKIGNDGQTPNTGAAAEPTA